MKKKIHAPSYYLEIEANAILKCAEKISAHFPKALTLIQEARKAKGKLIIMGMGKSHYIAAKIAASFMSIGVTSVFLHPAEAIHGDLGVIAENDLTIVISKSGGTPEIVALLPELTKKTKMIAIVGNLSSPIAQSSDCVLDASVDVEACPMNLLPTASTTLALAVGDCLVATIAQLENLTPEKFAGYHPGGSLGKRLTKKVLDIMIPIENIPVSKVSETIKNAAIIMNQKPVGALCIVDSEMFLKGIVTDGDIRRAIATGVPPDSELRNIYVATPIFLNPDLQIDSAISILENGKRKVSVAPVVGSDGKLKGLVRLHDLI